MQKFHSSLSQHESFTPRWLYISVVLRLLLLFRDIVDVVIKFLLRCQTTDMFSHLYRSGKFAYSMLNTTVTIAQRLFTHLCFVHVNYCAWIRNISADAVCWAVCQEIRPSCYASLLPLCCGVNVPTRCSLMVGGIDLYCLFSVTFLDICSREAQLIFSNK